MDFNEYAKNNSKKASNNSYGLDDNLFNMVSSIASQYNGKNQTELLKAIYQHAKKGKENKTLTNADIDNFVNMLAPMVDDKQRKLLYKVAEELKKI